MQDIIGSEGGTLEEEFESRKPSPRERMLLKAIMDLDGYLERAATLAH